MTDKDEMNEGMYLDAMNQLQKKFEENEKIITTLKIANRSLQKEIISAYGVIRLIDNYIDSSEVSYEVKTLIDCLRGHLSDLVEDKQQIQVGIVNIFYSSPNDTDSGGEE